jgi:SAM-dependent methyltransferase
MSKKKEKKVWEFGDFQTPDNLAAEATRILHDLHFEPKTIIEPTCGRGSFLLAAIRAFPQVAQVVGVDINKTYLNHLKRQLDHEPTHPKVTLKHADFFSLEWIDIVKELPEPILVLGNPPWVTSSELGALDSSNLPEKSNFQKRRGFDAITGKSNFDISEWMILQYLQWLKARHGFIAVLCKTAVARKVLTHAWKHAERLTSSRIYLIDAMKYFGASVDACFFIMEVGDSGTQECQLYDSLWETKPARRFGYRDGILASNKEQYEKWQHLRGVDLIYIWRSGIKHDCAKVLELYQEDGNFRNGYGEKVIIENTYLYPLNKSSDVGNGSEKHPRKYLLITQRYVGEETGHIRYDAPKTWRYLNSHKDDFSKRKSSIYEDRPPFSIFGVGEYTFSPWKVAISGFYKKLDFKSISPFHGHPVVFDDTVYFLPCWSVSEADFLVSILNSEPAKEFLSSMVFWSNKRPVTAELLRRLNLKLLSRELGRESEYYAYASQINNAHALVGPKQLVLGIAERQARYRPSHNKAFNHKRQRQRTN